MTVPTVGASGAPNRPSFRSRSCTIAPTRARAGSCMPKTTESVSNVQPSPWWLKSTPNMSNGIASPGTASRSAAKPNRACGSTNRRISQADAMRSTPGRGRVTQSRPWYVASVPAAARLRRSRGTGDVFLHLLQRCRDTIAPGAAEEIDGLNRCQPLPEPADESRDRRCPRAARPARGAHASQHPLDVARERRIRLLPRSPELLHQRVIGPGIDVVGGKHAGVAAAPLDLGLEPLEVFPGPRRVRQDVDGLLDGNGAELLQPPPCAHAEVRRGRGQLVHEEQPAAPRRRGSSGGYHAWPSFEAWRS